MKVSITREEVEQCLLEKKFSISKGYQKQLKTILDLVLAQGEEFSFQELAAILEKKTQGPAGSKVSRSTLKTRLKYVKFFLIWKLGKIHQTVLAFNVFISEINVEEGEIRLIDPKVVKRMLACLDINYEFMIWLGCKIGGRREALTELNLQDIVFVKLEDAAHFFPKKVFEDLIAKHGPEKELAEVNRWDKHAGARAKKQVKVPILFEYIPTLRKYLEKRVEAEQELKKTFEDEKGAYLIWNARGGRMNPDSATRHISNMSSEYGLDFKIHDCRRAAIQYWYSIGMTELHIKKLSGHRSDAVRLYFEPQKIEAYGELFSKAD